MSIAVNWGAVTHIGCTRSINQDAVLTGPAVFAVADGMGGHSAGEVASAMAIARLAQLSLNESQEQIVMAIREANSQILARGVRGGAQEGMGTTLSGVAFAQAVERGGLLAFNVGDSRVYHHGPKGLNQISVDHSLVEEMIRNGEMDPEQAQDHPAKNVVTRALGVDDDVDVDLWWIDPSVGDRILVCSDGLTNELTDAEIAHVLQGTYEPQAAVDVLLAQALKAGGHDNISVVVIQIIDQLMASANSDDDTQPGLGYQYESAH